MKITTCKDCPNTFEQKDSGNRQLCDACKLNRKQKRDRDYSYQHPKAERRRRKRAAAAAAETKTVIPIPEFNRIAREQQLSYGQLTARMRELRERSGTHG